MTRKHFILIAAALHSALEDAPNAEARGGVMLAANRIAAELPTTNPAFDSGRFLHAVAVG